MSVKRIGVVIGVLVAAVVLGGGALWFNRMPIAEYVAQRAFALRGMDAQLEVTGLGASNAVIEGVKLGPPAAPGLAIDRLELTYDFGELLSGRLRAISTEGLIARVRVDASGPRLAGFSGQGGGAEGGGAGAMLPALDIRDATLVLETTVGEASADWSFVGDAASGWLFELNAEPVEIERESGKARLDELNARLAIEADGGVDASTNLDLAVLDGAAFDAERVRFDAVFEGSGAQGGDFTGLVGSGVGRIRLANGVLGPEVVASLVAPVRKLLSYGALDPILAEHRSDAIDALAALAQDFELKGEVGATLTPDGDLQIKALKPIRLAGSNGAVLRVQSEPDKDAVLTLNGTTATARALTAVMSGGGLPKAGVTITAARYGPTDGREAITANGALVIEPWRAGQLSIGAGFPTIAFEIDQEGMRAQIDGTASIDGVSGGFGADDVNAQFSLRLAADDKGLLMRAADGEAQTITARGLSLGPAVLSDIEIEARPFGEDLPLMRADDDGLIAEAQLTQLSARIENGGAWDVGAPAAEVRYLREPGSAPSAQVRAQAPRAEGLAQSGGLSVQAAVFDLTAALEDETVRVTANVEGVHSEGEGAPAQLKRAVASVDAVWRSGELVDVEAIMPAAEVSDSQRNLRYAPLRLSGEAGTDGGVLAGTIRASLHNGRPLGVVQFEQPLDGGAAQARFETERLAFAPNALQPADLAPVLRGLITDARGAVLIEGDLRWGLDDVSGRVNVLIDGLDFITGIGRVTGLRTDLEIGDVFGVKTLEAQSARVEEFDPGLKFEDGVFSFDLDGDVLRIHNALFPFSGGELRLEPVDWSFTADGQTAVVLLDNVDLRDLVGLVKVPDLDVTGRVAGALPILVQRPSVYVVDGELTSLVAGRIAYTGEAAGRAADQNPSAKIAFDALSNFEYDALTFTLDGDVAGEMTLGMRAEGRNPDLYDGFPINFNLNTEADFARLFRNALQTLDVRTRIEEELEARAEE